MVYDGTTLLVGQIWHSYNSFGKRMNLQKI